MFWLQLTMSFNCIDLQAGERPYSCKQCSKMLASSSADCMSNPLQNSMCVLSATRLSRCFAISKFTCPRTFATLSVKRSESALTSTHVERDTITRRKWRTGRWKRILYYNIGLTPSLKIINICKRLYYSPVYCHSYQPAYPIDERGKISGVIFKRK